MNQPKNEAWYLDGCPREGGVPIHRSTVYLPGGETWHYDAFPTGKLDISGDCKYCHQTHSDWWQMKEEDYDTVVVLCEHCGYTSARENL